MSKITDFDIEELIRGMENLNDDVDVYDYTIENLNIEWDDFCKLIEKLLPLVVIGESPLTKTCYRGFGKNGVFFIKQKIPKEGK